MKHCLHYGAEIVLWVIRFTTFVTEVLHWHQTHWNNSCYIKKWHKIISKKGLYHKNKKSATIHFRSYKTYKLMEKKAFYLFDLHSRYKIECVKTSYSFLI